MIIKKFTARTENEAIANAKKELGEGVVVMNVKDIKAKGLFAFLKPHTVEVTVALEEENEKYTAAVSAINDVIASSQSKETPVIPAPAAPETMEEKPKKESSAIEEKLDSLQSLLEQQLQKPEEEKEKEDKKEESREEPKEETEIDRFMKLLHDTMLDNEVDEKYASEIIDEIGQINKPNMPFDYALANIYQKMILKFGKPDCITPAENDIKIVFFYRTDRGWQNDYDRQACIHIQSGSEEESRAADSRYLPDRRGGAAAYLCEYFGGAFPYHLHGGRSR